MNKLGLFAITLIMSAGLGCTSVYSSTTNGTDDFVLPSCFHCEIVNVPDARGLKTSPSQAWWDDEKKLLKQIYCANETFVKDYVNIEKAVLLLDDNKKGSIYEHKINRGERSENFLEKYDQLRQALRKILSLENLEYDDFILEKDAPNFEKIDKSCHDLLTELKGFVKSTKDRLNELTKVVAVLPRLERLFLHYHLFSLSQEALGFMNKNMNDPEYLKTGNEDWIIYVAFIGVTGTLLCSLAIPDEVYLFQCVGTIDLNSNN